ncbi:MFS transporter [Alkalihalobacterium bogoriense]|uniref:MFS transporter n=1 Tax=Alkalihalobacterium bogoriense TaxID=246272 RepID=UPI00068913FD|nr:MFS transporter [Alkalihalobacterium bogoriense]
MKGNKIHKGWFILILTIINMFACLGLGRFSLGAVIPFMREGLSLSYSEAGMIASAVFFGYLVSALGVGYLLHKFSVKQVIIFFLFVLGVGMTISSLAQSFWIAYLACLIIGLGSGGANVPSLGMVSRWFSQKYRGTALGITNSGSGLGMVFSGAIIPLLMVINPEDGWRLGWGMMAAIIMTVIVLNILFLVDAPEQVGLSPVGASTVQQVNNSSLQDENAGSHVVYRNPTVLTLGFIYFTWGFSYLIFSTFFVDYLLSDVGLAKQEAGFYFSVAGFFSIISGLIWGNISDRIGRVRTLFIIFFMQATLLITIITFTNPVVLLFITMVYALTLWAVPTVMVAAVGDMISPQKLSVAIGFITLFFGVGQWVSPMITGVVIDYFENYTVAFSLSATICYIGCVGCLVVYKKEKKNQCYKETIAG